MKLLEIKLRNMRNQQVSYEDFIHSRASEPLNGELITA